MSITPGSLVKYREREWVVLPSEEPEIIKLRPIGGSARETCGVLKSLSDLMGYTMPFERIKSAQFPLPEPDNVQDLAAVRRGPDGNRGRQRAAHSGGGGR